MSVEISRIRATAAYWNSSLGYVDVSFAFLLSLYFIYTSFCFIFFPYNFQSVFPFFFTTNYDRQDVMLAFRLSYALLLNIDLTLATTCREVIKE